MGYRTKEFVTGVQDAASGAVIASLAGGFAVACVTGLLGAAGVAETAIDAGIGGVVASMGVGVASTIVDRIDTIVDATYSPPTAHPWIRRIGRAFALAAILGTDAYISIHSACTPVPETFRFESSDCNGRAARDTITRMRHDGVKTTTCTQR